MTRCIADSSITVVVPSFGSEPTLSRCIESVLMYGTIPVVVVHSGGGEASWSTGGGVQVFERHERLFAGAARNLGAAAARTSWLAFLDSDCVWNTGWIRTAMAFMTRPGLLAANGPVYYERPRNSLAYALHILEFHEFLTSQPGYQPRFLHSGNLLIRRSFFEDLGGFRESFEACQDISFLGQKSTDDYPKGSFVYHPDLAITHLAHLEEPEAVKKKMFFMGQKRGEYDSKLAPRFQIRRKKLYPLVKPVLGLSFLALCIWRCLRTRSFVCRHLPLLLLKMWHLSHIWAKGFHSLESASPAKSD